MENHEVKLSASSEDYFRSSAGYYTDYRKPYPAALFEPMRGSFQTGSENALLDVGCGTGQIALPLRDDFGRVVGVDLSQEMIDYVNQRSEELGATNTEFIQLAGEEIGSLTGPFDLITYGSALHWMDIRRSLAACGDLLSEGGGVAILAMSSIWGGKADWEQAVVRVVQKWMGDDRRAGSSTFNSSTNGVSFEDALVNAGFDIFNSGVVEASYSVDIPFIIGHLYTTSYCNRDLLGENVEAFERDLSQTLLELNSVGEFQWSPGASYIFGRKAA